MSSPSDPQQEVSMSTVPASALIREEDAPTAVLSAQPAPSASKPAPTRNRWSRRRKILMIGLVCLLVATSLGGVFTFLNYNNLYQRDKALAQHGVQHLLSAQQALKDVAQGSLDEQKIKQARAEFAQSLTMFRQVQGDLGQIPQPATSVPHYGSLVTAAFHLVPIAVNVSQAGVLGCDMASSLLTLLHDPLGTKGGGLAPKDFTTLKNTFAQFKAVVDVAIDEADRLQPSDLQLDPRIGPAMAKFRTLLPTVKAALPQVQSMLDLAPAMLGIGKPASYLLTQMDSTELRPGGGFIGNYGILSLAGGKLSKLALTDIYLLDYGYSQSGKTIAYPPAYSWFTLAPETWSLRDSNLDADFPTFAHYAEQIYQTESGSSGVQGVISITPALIKNLLAITGPIYVDEYKETITADNLIDRIHYYQLKVEWNGGSVPSPDGLSSRRKHFTAVLFEHFLARVQQIFPQHVSQLVHIFSDALHSKDIQVYLNSNQAEQLLHQYQLDSSIQSPPGDSLFNVDANITGSKTNGFMTYALHDDITLDEARNATHHATLTYNWPLTQESLNNNYGNSTTNYTDYLRIYTPPGSTLQTHDGLDAIDSSQHFKRQVWGSDFSLDIGHSKVITLTWTVPAAAHKDGHGWQYQFLLQRQPGVLWHLDLHVHLPGCARMIGQPHDARASGPQELTVSQDLTTDLALSAGYTCENK
ncbi:MAG TPA: DUF4012 domain-containing protein [Ktedonobacteraceae bacterium]|nr:DUF4012 domain-containing protein [Ktedonobacteraceae bacterium]